MLKPTSKRRFSYNGRRYMVQNRPDKGPAEKYYLCEVLPGGVLAPLYNKFGWRLEYFKTIKEAQVYVKYCYVERARHFAAPPQKIRGGVFFLWAALFLAAIKNTKIQRYSLDDLRIENPAFVWYHTDIETPRGYTKMFKKLVYKIAAIKTEGDRNECFAEIDKAFDNDKITWNDHETLYSLAAAVVTAEN